MYFKFICFVVVSFLISSCGLKINDTVKKADPVSVEETCLSKIDKVTENYYLGKLSDAEILNFNKCALNTVEIFRNHVAGEDKGLAVSQRSHKKLELKRFFQKVIFSEDKVVTDDLVNSLMSFKVLIVGGSEDSVTNQELTALKSWLELIADSFKRLNPFMALMSEKSRGEGFEARNLDKEIDLLEAQLNKISYNFRVMLPNNGKTIKITEIQNLVLSLMKFYGWDKDSDKSSRLENAKHTFGLIKAMKSTLLDEVDGDKIFKNQWNPFLKVLISSYKSYLSLELTAYNFKRGQFSYKLINKAVQAIIITLNEGKRNYHTDKTIPFEKIDKVIEASYKFESIQKKYKLKSLKSMTRVLVNKLFNPYYEEEAAADSYPGITEQHIGFLTMFRLSWYNSINLINQNKFSETSLWSIKKYIKSFYTKYSFLIGLNYRAFTDEGLRDVQNLSLASSMDHLVRLIIKAYSKKLEYAVVDVGLTSDEIQEFTDDIKPVLLDLKMINEDISNAGEKMYFEGNLFTPTGNGFPLHPVEEGQRPLLDIIQKITEFHAEKKTARIKKVFFNAEDSKVEYIKKNRAVLERDEMLNMGLYIFSAANSAKKMYNKLTSKEGCLVNQKSPDDLYCKKMVPRQCFEDNLYPMINEGLSGLSDLHSFIFKDEVDRKYLNKKEKMDAFKDVLMKTILLPNENTEQLGYIHVVKLAQISHYVETSVLRFDLNKNGKIDKHEVDEAYPHFEGLIDLMIKSSSVKALVEKRDSKLKKLNDKFINGKVSADDYKDQKIVIERKYSKKIKKAKSLKKGKETYKDKNILEVGATAVKNGWRNTKNSLGKEKRKNIFLYMMEKGDIPTAGDVAHAATIKRFEGWDIDIDRLRAFSIFGGVINAVNADDDTKEKNFSYSAEDNNVNCSQ